VLESLLYGLDLADLPTYPDRINAVTVDEIQRVTRTYLQPRQLSVVLVGEASAFVDDLVGVGFDDVEVLSIDDIGPFLVRDDQAVSVDSFPSLLPLIP